MEKMLSTWRCAAEHGDGGWSGGVAIKRPLLGKGKRIGDGDAETKSDVLLPQVSQNTTTATMSRR